MKNGKARKKRTVMQATYPFSFIPYYPASKHCAYGKNNIEIHKFNSLNPGFTQLGSILIIRVCQLVWPTRLLSHILHQKLLTYFLFLQVIHSKSIKLSIFKKKSCFEEKGKQLGELVEMFCLSFRKFLSNVLKFLYLNST